MDVIGQIRPSSINQYPNREMAAVSDRLFLTCISAPSSSPSCRNITDPFRSFTGNYKPSPLLHRSVNSRSSQGLGISHSTPIRRICCAHMACYYVDHRSDEPPFVQEWIANFAWSRKAEQSSSGFESPVRDQTLCELLSAHQVR